MNLRTTIMRNGVKHVFVRKARGVGDVVAHVLHTGTVGKVVKAITGMDAPCGGCKKRQERLNELLPLSK